MHDAASAQYNPDCISCHGDMTDRTTLSADVEEIHPTMIPWVLPAGGEPRINNQTCASCHESVDFLGGSAANLRKQVAVTICAGCHGPPGPATTTLYR
jgi:cytochrome c553